MGSSGSFKSQKLGRVSLSFLLDLIKNSKQLKSNVPKHTLKVFWVTTLVTEKKLSKKLLGWGNLVSQKKETKESKIYLGSCLAVWKANNMCTCIAQYQNLKYNKGNYLKIKLQIFIKMLAKRG